MRFRPFLAWTAAVITAPPGQASASSWLRWLGLDGDSASQHVLSDAKPDVPALHRTSGYVAFGDSYSAGIGTHLDGKEEDCRFGLGAYPYLIYNDLLDSQDANASIAFQWLSCTGATTDDLLSGGATSQVDDFNITADVDMATLSIGGNDLGFFDVMNACIFRFYSFYSGTCEAALAKAELAIESPDFEHRLFIVLLQILDKAHWEKRPGFSITVTGYARFFDADTALCDDCSMGVWWSGPKLTRAIRNEMNALVLAVNIKLRRTVEAVNARFTRPRVFFVTYDDEFEGHRFCEKNVTEPDYTRDDTWFFLVGGVDSGQNGTMPNGTFPNATAAVTAGYPDQVDLMSPLSPLVNPDTCLEPARRRGDWGELAVCYMAMAKQRDPSLQPAHDRLRTQNSMWYVPTYYGKTFHPRSRGHKVIRDKVYEVWEKNRL